MIEHRLGNPVKIKRIRNRGAISRLFNRRSNETSQSAQRSGGRAAIGRAGVARMGGTAGAWAGERGGVTEELEGFARAGRRRGADDRAAQALERRVEEDPHPGTIWRAARRRHRERWQQSVER